MKIKIKIDIDKLKNDVMSQLGESLLKRVTVSKYTNLATNLRIWIQAKMNKLHSSTIAKQLMIKGFDHYEINKDWKNGLYQFIQDGRYDSALRSVCAVQGLSELTRMMLNTINGFSNEWYVLRKQSSQKIHKETNKSTVSWITWLKDNGLYIDIHKKNSQGKSLMNYAKLHKNNFGLLGDIMRVNQKKHESKLFQILNTSLVKESKDTGDNKATNGLLDEITYFLDDKSLVNFSKSNHGFHAMLKTDIKKRYVDVVRANILNYERYKVKGLRFRHQLIPSIRLGGQE